MAAEPDSMRQEAVKPEGIIPSVDELGLVWTDANSAIQEAQVTQLEALLRCIEKTYEEDGKVPTADNTPIILNGCQVERPILHSIFPGDPATFNTTTDLYAHIRKFCKQLTIKSGTKKKLACPYCGKLSACMPMLVYHVRTHTLEKPYVCPIPDCPAKDPCLHRCNIKSEGRFATKCNLKAHMQGGCHGWIEFEKWVDVLDFDTPKPMYKKRRAAKIDKMIKETPFEDMMQMAMIHQRQQMIHQQIAQQYSLANMANASHDLGEGYGQGTQASPYTMDGIDVLLANPVPPPPMFGPDGELLMKQEPGLVKPEMGNFAPPIDGMMHDGKQISPDGMSTMMNVFSSNTGIMQPDDIPNQYIPAEVTMDMLEQ